MSDTAEQNRLKNRKDNKGWKKWGPYLSERQWATVREDYSADGNAWGFFPHDASRSRAYRWGEDGLAGISDNKQFICFSWAFWNHQDSILKERLFGLTGQEGNHGEDVKELYYYLDSTPTHSYMKMLYKYPQTAFPYQELVEENGKRSREEPEYELLDTGIFDNNNYFDALIEYAKADENDILIKATITNRSAKEAVITALPTICFRNTWAWGYEEFSQKPLMSGIHNTIVDISHKQMGKYKLYCEAADELLFCDNDTNHCRLFGATTNPTPYAKDGINEYIVDDKKEAVNPNSIGTKAAARYTRTLKASESIVVRLRLSNQSNHQPFNDFDTIFAQRLHEADEFYGDLQKNISETDLRNIQRQAYAGMLWSKQFYYYNMNEWLAGDPAMPAPDIHRKNGRNNTWKHLYNANLLSMPDKWEYPWFAAWDLAFHTLPLARLDPDFAKRQLSVILREYYMHPSGQIPAYEWSFSDVNPPVHAWATWKVYEIDKEKNKGVGDIEFLERVFHKLLLNFTWWVNRKDLSGNNIFGGGFLGMDNIGVFDRSSPLPNGGYIEQADGTGWMAMFTLNMLRISCEISRERPVYQEMASKFFEHFLHIAAAMKAIGEEHIGLWDEEDQFYYDIMHAPNEESVLLKIRSMVGLIPLFAVEVLAEDLVEHLPDFNRRVEWTLANRPDLASLISRWTEHGKKETRLLAVLRGHRMRMILKRMLDESEFLSDFGIRSLSKYHKENPYRFFVRGEEFRVDYAPAESNLAMLGGNSNWRGPIWFPMNFLIVDSLMKFYEYYGDDFEVEFPTHSGNMVSIQDAALGLSDKLINIFRKDDNGNRPVFGKSAKEQNDPHFSDSILFYEYFNGDNGAGCGASHQTGWTGLVAELIEIQAKYKHLRKS